MYSTFFSNKNKNRNILYFPGASRNSRKRHLFQFLSSDISNILFKRWRSAQQIFLLRPTVFVVKIFTLTRKSTFIRSRYNIPFFKNELAKDKFLKFFRRY